MPRQQAAHATLNKLLRAPALQEALGAALRSREHLLKLREPQLPGAINVERFDYSFDVHVQPKVCLDNLHDLSHVRRPRLIGVSTASHEGVHCAGGEKKRYKYSGLFHGSWSGPESDERVFQNLRIESGRGRRRSLISLGRVRACSKISPVGRVGSGPPGSDPTPTRDLVRPMKNSTENIRYIAPGKNKQKPSHS